MTKPGRLVPRFGAGGRAASAGSGHGRAGPTSGVDPGAGHRTPCGWNRTAPTARALPRSEAGEAGGGVRRRRRAWNGCRRPVPSWPGRSGGAPRRLAEPSLTSALSVARAPCPQHGRNPLLRTERGTRFAPSVFPCSSVMHPVRARLGLIPRSQGRESTAKRGLLRSLGGSRRSDRQEHGSQATEVLRFVASAGRGTRPAKPDQDERPDRRRHRGLHGPVSNEVLSIQLVTMILTSPHLPAMLFATDS